MINDKFEMIKSYKKAYKNYFRVLYMLYIKRKESYRNNEIKIKVVLRDGRTITVPYGFITTYARLKTYKNQNISSLNLTNEGVSFQYKDHPVIIDPGRFSYPEEVFLREEYNFLNVTNCDVVDVGMNIGDSAIYFTLNGARKVIGLEPYPYAFSYAEKNVKLNDIKNIITLNAGYGKDSIILIDNNKISLNTSSLISSNNGGKEILIYSLKTLLNKYEIENAVLKMDCEGCEYNLLDEDEEVLRRFRMIQVEYHYGYQKLKEK